MARIIEKARVKAGALFLDVIRPGWAQDVADDIAKNGGDIQNPKNYTGRSKARFDMSSGCACVLGHLFGEYGKGAETLFAMRATTGPNENSGACNYGVAHAAYETGFVAEPERPKEGEKRLDYTILTDLWHAEILKRLRKRVTKKATPTVNLRACRLCGPDRDCHYPQL